MQFRSNLHFKPEANISKSMFLNLVSLTFAVDITLTVCGRSTEQSFFLVFLASFDLVIRDCLGVVFICAYQF